MRGLLWIAVPLALFARAPAFAQGTEEQRSACKADAYRLCDRVHSRFRRRGELPARKYARAEPGLSARIRRRVQKEASLRHIRASGRETIPRRRVGSF